MQRLWREPLRVACLRRIPQMPLIISAPACLSLCLLLAPLGAGANPVAPAQAASGAPAAARSPAPTHATATATAKKLSHVVVLEDDNVRIEESRSRGRVQSIHVQSKVGSVLAYDIQVAPAGRDPSQERGNAGQRTWSLFSF